MNQFPKIAVVGCGAISEIYHLPGLAKHPAALAKAILVDPDQDRVEALQAAYDVAGSTQDYRTILNEVDGAIVATPHHLHAPIVSAFLEHGVPVLCEKPLAATVEESRELVALSNTTGVPLAVNQTRRLFPAYGRIKTMLDDGALGTLTALEYSDGKAFRWPTKSGFYFRQTGGAGVLLDKGVHGLDTVCWWLGGIPQNVSSYNDAMGGREAVSHITARLEMCDIQIKFSWLAKLPNRFKIVGDGGTISGDIEGWSQFTWQPRGQKAQKISVPTSYQKYNDFSEPMIGNFIDVIGGRAAPLVSAADALPALVWIDDCYKQARLFEMPWLHTPMTQGVFDG